MHACIMSQANKKKPSLGLGRWLAQWILATKAFIKYFKKKNPGIVLSSSSLGAEETDAHWLWHAQPT